MAGDKDYYKILNLSKKATNAEIKKSYRNLARKYHPDLNPNNKVAEDKFKEVSEAYEVLSDDSKRKKYDSGEYNISGNQGHNQDAAYYKTQANQNSRYQDIFRENFGDFNFEDIFNQQGQRSRAMRGEDQIYKMEVEFKEAVLGVEKTFTMPNGNKIAAKIPAGIRSGQKIKLAGRGGPGYNGGPAGDAFIEIQVKSSDQFKVDGQNIETQVPLLFSTAILGGKIRVPTVDGAVEIDIPEGINSGTKLRIKGKGLPGTQGRSNGDLYAVIKITLPEKISSELKECISKWVNDSDSNQEVH